MEKTSKKKNTTLAVMAVIFAVSLMCSCSGGEAPQSVDSERAKDPVGQEQVSVEQVSGGSSSENGESEKTVRRTVQLNLSEEQEEGNVLDFGSDSVFGGIEMETDENGELIYSDQGGSIWYKVTDKRFGSYSQLSRFVRKSMNSSAAGEFLSAADTYFVTRDGGLYLVDGAAGRTISSSKRYVLAGGSAIRISAAHTAECRKKYGISHSSVDFVKSDGTWKLNSIRNA